jgi:hypothetical protein
MRAALAFAAFTGAFWPALAYAGPCAEDLYKADIEIGRRLDDIAAKGRAGAESNFATMHRQPTPGTIAGAEEQIGDISDTQVQAVRNYLADAKKADDAGDKPACEQALSQARQILGM